MRFGVCAGVERAAILAEAGYDFIELSVAADLMASEDAEWWREQRARLRALPLPVETFNSFARAGKITGPDANEDSLSRYVSIAMERASEVGGKVIVFGSGGARNVPEGFDRALAHAQLGQFLTLCADAHDRAGSVIVAIEPLRQAESNIINRVRDGAARARQIARPGVQVLADTYHMAEEGELLSAIVDARDVLAHVHVADDGRLAPATGSYDYVSLFGALREAEYDKRVSIECGWGPDFAGEATRALAHLKAEHAAANNGDLEISS